MRRRLIGVVLCAVVVLLLMPAASASAATPGWCTIRVVDNLTGLPISGAWLDTDWPEVGETDADGLIQKEVPTGSTVVHATGYQTYSIDSEIADGATVTVRLRLKSGWGVIAGLVKDSTTGLVITSGIQGVSNAYPIGSLQRDDQLPFEVSSRGVFCNAAPVGEKTVSFDDDSGRYATEFYKDTPFYSAATRVTVTDGAATRITVSLGAGSSISGSIGANDGWTPTSGFVSAWALNPTSGSWELVKSQWESGPTYAITGLPAGTYKLMIDAAVVDPNAPDPDGLRDGMGVTAWYKYGAAVMNSLGGETAKISLAQPVAVGPSQKRTGINFALKHPTRTVARIAGATRYDVAAGLARAGWDPGGDKSWDSVKHVIVANGEPGKEADPLAAAGLAGAYECPVLLTQTTSVPASTRTVIAEIAKKNPGVKIHIIGGTGSVPDARWDEIRAIPGVSATKDRIAGATRYDVSVNVAVRSRAVRMGLNGVFVVAADNANAFYDALAASPAAYAEGMAILYVQKDAVPPAVATLLAGSLKNLPRYVVNSSVYVSDATKSKVGATDRLATSSNRYTAATQIAAACRAQEWIEAPSVAIAASLPDALTGGVFSGRCDGALLFTDSTTALQPVTQTYITQRKADIYQGWVIGGTGSVPLTQETTFRNLLK